VLGVLECFLSLGVNSGINLVCWVTYISTGAVKDFMAINWAVVAGSVAVTGHVGIMSEEDGSVCDRGEVEGECK
jgi:hypothetical protein